MEWDRRPDPAWQHALDAVYPPSDHLSSFTIRWEPGEPWQPIERWMIWQMRPVRFTRPDILAALQGPHPRSTGHYCAAGWCLCRLKTNNWRGGATKLIDRATWELYRETGRYGVRWWTVQGDQGGHRHRLTAGEQQIAKFFAGTPDTPKPGDLPYAPWDLRSYWKVAEADRVRCWNAAVAFHERSHDQMDDEEVAVAEKAGELLWSWLESQVKKTTEALSRAQQRALVDYARDHTQPWERRSARMDMDNARQSVVTAGI